MDAKALPEAPALFESELAKRASEEEKVAKDLELNGEQALDVEGFEEERYLAAFPDIAEDVAIGKWESGREHYVAHGAQEGRLSNPRYLSAFPPDDSAAFPAGNIDAVFISPTGWCLITGWIDDEHKPLRAVAWMKSNQVIATTNRFARCRREDAEAVLGARHGKLLGFWTISHMETGVTSFSLLSLRLWTGYEYKTFNLSPKYVDDRQLREITLEYLASARYFTNPQVESILQLKSGIGSVLVNYNSELSEKIISGAGVEYFGRCKGRWSASIVVCLFGRPEYLFLQAALFSSCPGVEEYEFIYVSNSPELAERLLKEAAMASRIYGLTITLVILPSNAGFGAANNVAASHARSDRILVVNPDVFPRDQTWATRHNEIVANLPVDQTAMFGVPLYYEDGSLMHGGMYFDFDTVVSIGHDLVERSQVVRVEHYAKGAPPNTYAFLKSRRVPAVTGAFISIDRAWFEALGGFSLEYVFGHYEDADLCLKSLERGKSVWVHNVAFWHLEGKGSIRRLAHEGGSTVNRWHFMETWSSFILDGLLGPSPSRFSGDAV